MSIDNVIYALLFFLPAGFSNMMPVFASRLPVIKQWTTPLDFGKSWRGKRIFGANKSWRGLVTGTVAGTLLGVALYYLFLADEVGIIYITASAAMAAGALIGDAVESFFKRQRGVASGQSWFPFDQTDYIVGGLVFVAPFSLLSPWLIVWVFSLFFGLHLLSSYVGYLLGLKDQPI